MPRIIQIEFSKTYNDSNYESSKIGLQAELGVNEDYAEAFDIVLDTIEELRIKQLDRNKPAERKRR
jgi:hypothetical protein